MNHLFVPATTGEVSEYQELKGKKISDKVSVVIGEWLQKTG